MRVKKKNLFYEFLPNKKDKKRIMAAEGNTVGQGPVDPRIKNMVKTLPDNYFDIFGTQPKAQPPGLAPIPAQGPQPITATPLPTQQPLSNPGTRPPVHPHSATGWGKPALEGILGLDAIMPHQRIHNQEVIHPEDQRGYQPYPYGTGSSALMASGGPVQDGGKKPIPVSDSKDPRLQRYNDSLSVYNELQRSTKYLQKPSTTPESWQKEIGRWKGTPGEAAYERLMKYNGKAMSTHITGERTFPGYEDIPAHSRSTDKPVQPYEYKPEKEELDWGNLKTKSIFDPHAPANQSNAIHALPFAVKEAPMSMGPLAGGKTPFSFTSRDQQGQQTTRYFNDRDTWQSASDMLGYSHRELSNQDREGHATGIGNQFDDGGWMMNPMRDNPIIIPEGVADNTPGAKNGFQIPIARTLQYENLPEAYHGYRIKNDVVHMKELPTQKQMKDRMEKAKSGNWIKGAVNPKHKGYCTPMTKSTCTPRRKVFAKTMKKHHGFHKKEDGGVLEALLAYGGIIPDNMSNFSPHEYAYGGTARGGSDSMDMLENIFFHPSSADMAGYAMGGSMGGGMGHEGGGVGHMSGHSMLGLYGVGDNESPYPKKRKKKKNGSYEEGGSMRGGSDTPDMLENIFFHPNSQDMAGYYNGGNIRGGSDTTDMLENIFFHPSSADMRGWDSAASGKTLSRSKAREMLHDKSAHGHPLTDRQRKYFGAVASGYAAAGLPVPGGGGGSTDPKYSPQETYYRNSAQLAYYKGVLNDKLKAKNPEGYGSYFKGLTDLRRSGKPGNADKYIQDSKYNDYLSPDEVKQTLGKEYDNYINSVKGVNTYNVAQGQQPLYGNVEGQNDINHLNYGRRFASLSMTPSVSVHRGDKDYNRSYSYDPQKGVTYSETGDTSLLPTYLGGKPQQPPNQGNTIQRIQQAAEQGKLREGGVMYADGGNVETMWGGNVEQKAYNPYDGGTMQFNGQSHEQGGIGMHYNGNPVEVEGGETASRDSQGNLNIYGNMYLPGTRTKFKSVAKEIADKEKAYDGLRMRGAELVNNSNPADKFGKLAFNAGRVMMLGGTVGQKDLAEKKENLAHLQRAMLDTADEYGLDAQHMSKGNIKKAKKGGKAKGGAYIPFAEDGITTEEQGGPNDPTRSDRNKNPGNIKYGDWAKAHGAVGKDKDGFAIFGDRDSGELAMRSLLQSKSYNNMSVKDAIHKWTDGKPYRHDLGGLENKRVGDLSQEEFDSVVEGMKTGEGTRYGTARAKVPVKPLPQSPGKPQIPYTPLRLPDLPLTPEGKRPTPPGATPPPLGEIPTPGRPNLPTNAEPLQLEEVLPEMYAAATNRVEPVPMQKYRPELYTPYQVSFQDRLNQNQSSFNALQRTLGSTNPNALGALAAQKYGADNSVKAEEFRTNQAISNDITNRNISLNNDSQLKNLAIADQQYDRQEGARSKTREYNQMILNSLSSKYAQNKLENKRLKTYENLYDYRFVPTEQGGLQATYMGPNAMFNFNQTPANSRQQQDVRTVSQYDKSGNLKGYRTYDESGLREAKQAIELEEQRRKLPLLSVPPL